MTDVSSTGDGGIGGDGVRERLLRAAATVFARQGYDGTRIMDVVHESGLSTGAVYGRFRSKDDLLGEAIVTYAGRAVDIGAEGVGGVVDLVTAAGFPIATPLGDAEALRLEAYVTARRQPRVAAALEESYDVVRRRLAPLLAAAQAEGTVGGADADAALFLARVLNLGLVLHRGSGLPGPDPAAWRALVERVAQAAVAGGGDPPASADPAPPP